MILAGRCGAENAILQILMCIFMFVVLVMIKKRVVRRPTQRTLQEWKPLGTRNTKPKTLSWSPKKAITLWFLFNVTFVCTGSFLNCKRKWGSASEGDRSVGFGQIGRPLHP